MRQEKSESRKGRVITVISDTFTGALHNVIQLFQRLSSLQLANDTINQAFLLLSCEALCRLVSPVVVIGTVVVSISAGRVGVTVSAGVEVSTGTNIIQLRSEMAEWNNPQTLDHCTKDALITQCFFKRLFMRYLSLCMAVSGNTDRRGNDKASTAGVSNQSPYILVLFQHLNITCQCPIKGQFKCTP